MMRRSFMQLLAIASPALLSKQIMAVQQLPQISFTQQPHASGMSAPDRKLTPFLVKPFRSSDGNLLSGTEGYIYSAEEYGIHGFKTHYGDDMAAPEGTKVYAPSPGITVRGRHTYRVRDDKGNPLLYKGKSIGFGLGNFVQIWNEQQGVYVMLGHMKTVADNIPPVWSAVQENGDVTPNGRFSQLNDKSIGVRVKVGDYLGTVGHSGLGWGESEAVQVDPVVSWDEFHLHLEVYERTPDGRKNPKARWDPLGWYQSRDEQKRYALLEQSEAGLFLEDKFHRIRFAR